MPCLHNNSNQALIHDLDNSLKINVTCSINPRRCAIFFVFWYAWSALLATDKNKTIIGVLAQAGISTLIPVPPQLPFLLSVQ